jgi:hypothetical protein
MASTFETATPAEGALSDEELESVSGGMINLRAEGVSKVRQPIEP